MIFSMNQILYTLIFAVLILQSENAPLSQCAPKCDCYNKEMKCIDQHLTAVPKWNMGTFVELLDLSDNKFEVLFNNSFFNFPRLKDIYLNNAHIRCLETSIFDGLVLLEKLDLSNNYIEYIEPSTFASNKNLQTVILSKNMLQLQDEPLLISASIVNLDLSQCEISYLPNNVLSGLPGLKTLDLSYNSLSHLSPDTFATQSDLNIIDVSNNDWKCDDNFETLMCWIFQHMAEHDKISTTFCYDEKQKKQTWTVKSCKLLNVYTNAGTDNSGIVQYTTSQRTQLEQHDNTTNNVILVTQFDQHDKTTNIVITETQFEQHDKTTNNVITQLDQHDETTNIVITERQFDQHDKTTNIVITETQFDQNDKTTNILTTEPQSNQQDTFHQSVQNNEGWFFSKTFSLFEVTIFIIMVIVGANITGRWIVNKRTTSDIAYSRSNNQQNSDCVEKSKLVQDHTHEEIQ